MAARSRRICGKARSTRWIMEAMPARRAWVAAAVRAASPSWAVTPVLRQDRPDCLALAGLGEVGCAEGGAPDAVEVVLRAAQVQGECLVEEPEADKGLFEPVDSAGGWPEDLMQVVGGGVVWRALGDGPPLLLLAPPVEQIGAELEVADSGDGPAYRLGGFKAFLAQPEHVRHQRFAARRATIS